MVSAVESARARRAPPPYRSFPISNCSAPALTEADLSRLWEGQRFPPAALTTRDGERLRVVYRGRASRGPGPDFRDAIIAAPTGLLQGDIELHVRSGDFRRHGHDADPAYARVALHVVFWDDTGANTVLPGGGTAPVVALAGWVDGRAREIRAWLERPPRWREPCQSAADRLGVAETGAVLDRLGSMRFRQKTAAFASRLAGGDADQTLWEGLLEALGYGGDRAPFALLSQRLPWRQLRAALRPLPPRVRADEAGRLLLEAASHGLAATPRAGLRPCNRPERRLLGAAALGARFALTGFAAALTPLVAGAAEGGVRRLAGALMAPPHIGRSRALEILANAVLPCLAAGDEPQARLAEAAFARLPLPARYGAVRHLHEAIGQGVTINARRQQGMLYLLKQYCTRGGCGSCPLS